MLAHPDDVDYGASATVAGWVERGIDVSYLLVTRGDAGGFDEAVPRELIPGIREAEQRAAAAEIGVKRVEFLDGHADGTLAPTPDLRRDIAGAIRRYRPDRVLTNSPLRRWDRLPGAGHPDHQAVGEATTCAVYPDARNPFAFPELARAGLAPWTVREIWFFGGPNPDHFVDVTETFARKIAALRAHESQTAHTDVETFVRGLLAANARAAGLPDGALAEAFTIVRSAW